MHIEAEKDGVSRTFNARTTRTSGRSATLSLAGPFSGESIRSITTVGRECPTTAEDARENIMLLAMQGKVLVKTNPFIQSIWLANRKPSWSGCPVMPISPTFHFPSKRSLNNSQRKAVNAILSNADSDRVVLIQGPPGTGKTTVIAASVISVMASSDKTNTLWLVAQSNVAVKNMAEKLATENFLDFKILVSKEFHFDWYVSFSKRPTFCAETSLHFRHEHLYEKMERNLIRSDEFDDDIVAMERLLLDSKVLLCTISMLSNMKLGPFIRLVPPQTVIFDEASQIEIGDYFPMLISFRSTLRKLVFIGDDKQRGSDNLFFSPGINLFFSSGSIRSK